MDANGAASCLRQTSAANDLIDTGEALHRRSESFIYVLLVNEMVRPNLLREMLGGPACISGHAALLRHFPRHIQPDPHVQQLDHARVVEGLETFEYHAVQVPVLALFLEMLQNQVVVKRLRYVPGRLLSTFKKTVLTNNADPRAAGRINKSRSAILVASLSLLQLAGTADRLANLLSQGGFPSTTHA